jgi:hypothetical protein
MKNKTLAFIAAIAIMAISACLFINTVQAKPTHPRATKILISVTDMNGIRAANFPIMISNLGHWPYNGPLYPPVPITNVYITNNGGTFAIDTSTETIYTPGSYWNILYSIGGIWIGFNGFTVGEKGVTRVIVALPRPLP